MAYYRLVITKRKGTGDEVLQFSELNFYDKNSNKISWSVVNIQCNMKGVSTSESIDKILDGNINTKFCTREWGRVLENECIITIQVNDSMTFPAKYSYVTGNDSPNRDPVSWTLSYSKDGTSYTIISEVTDASITSNRKAETQLFEVYAIVNYNTIEEIVAGVENATQLVTSTKYDENSYMISNIPDFVKYKGISVSTIYANGNSWIGFDAESEHFKFNRRDAAMYNLWIEEGTYLDTHRFFRVRWGGVCKYDAYGDPYFQTFDIIIFDTGEVMLYSVDIPTQYYDGTFSFADVVYNTPTTDSRYVTFYTKSDGTYRTEYAPIEFVQDMTRYLVRDGATIYTVTDGTLVEVTGTLNADMFKASGVDMIPDGALLMTLNAPEVLCWTNTEQLPVLTATVQGVPTGEHEIISDNIQIGHSSIYGITSVETTASDGATFLLSFDGGAWMSYTDGKWSASDVGMNASELIAIPTEAWSSVVNSSQNMKLKATLDGVDTVTQVKFNFNNENPVVLEESEV